MSKTKMNLPNKLTVLRIIMVPIFLVVMMLPDSVIPFNISGIIGISIFIIASLTDMLDGKIARKYNLVTDFGKLMDPLADKFLVIGALTVIVYRYANVRTLFIIALLIVVFRELAVTSIRLVAASSGGVVIAANMLGKIKTVTQIVAISTVFLEPVVQWIVKLIAEAITGQTLAWRTDIIPLTWVSIALSLVMTIWSGMNYIIDCWKYLDPEK